MSLSNDKKIISTQNAPKAIGAYSQGVEHNGIYYFSGQIGLDPNTMELQSGLESQLNQIFKNIDGLLDHCSLKRENIIKTTIFLKDMNDFPKINNGYEGYFSQPFPARSCVEVSRLPKDALVEIEVLAAANPSK